MPTYITYLFPGVSILSVLVTSLNHALLMKEYAGCLRIDEWCT